VSCVVSFVPIPGRFRSSVSRHRCPEHRVDATLCCNSCRRESVLGPKGPGFKSRRPEYLQTVGQNGDAFGASSSSRFVCLPRSTVQRRTALDVGIGDPRVTDLHRNCLHTPRRRHAPRGVSTSSPSHSPPATPSLTRCSTNLVRVVCLAGQPMTRKFSRAADWGRKGGTKFAVS
jgi:hypothetical protein